MIREAYFFRGVINLEELKQKTQLAVKNKSRKQRYEVLKHHVMNHKEFLGFCEYFKVTLKSINEISHELTINENGAYNCLSLTSIESEYEILVNSSGYSYARIVAMIRKGNENGI